METPPNPTSDVRIAPNNRIFFWIKQTVSLLFWCYVLVKTFIFDFDIYLIQKFAPEWAWLVYSKFLILIGLGAILWLFTKNATILRWLLYILFYPLILICKLTFLMFWTESWLLIIGVLNFALSFLHSAKYRFITFTISLISLAFVFFAHNPFILGIAILILMGILVVIFGRCFYHAFRPSLLYQTHSKLVSKLLNWGKKEWVPKGDLATLAISQMTQDQLKLWASTLELSVVANRLRAFFSSKLKQYQKSNVTVALDIINVFTLTLITVLFFTAVNFALYKINPRFFDIRVQPSVFIFFYYSITNLLGRGINEVTPIANLSRLISVFEMLFALSSLGILISLFFSVKNKRDSEEIDTAISRIRREGTEMEAFIQQEYRLSVHDAIQELDRLKANMIKIIYYLSQNIDTDSSH
jgi:hypothetical protein